MCSRYLDRQQFFLAKISESMNRLKSSHQVLRRDPWCALWSHERSKRAVHLPLWVLATITSRTKWQMFKRILVSRIENDVHHPSADETKAIAKMPHPRAHYSYSVHVYVYGLHIQMYICMLYINSKSSRHCAYRPTTKS